MEHEGFEPVESVEGGGDFGGQAMPDAPPWLGGVQEDFAKQLGQHQREPYEEDYEQAAGYPDEYSDEPGPEDAYREDDGLGDDAFDLEAFADEFAPDDDAIGEDEQAFRDHLTGELGREEWKQDLTRRMDEFEQALWEDRLEALCEELPALNDPRVAGAVFGAMGAFARELELPDKLAVDPRFARMAYLAMRAENMMAREKPAGNGSDVVLEMGGVADPGEPAEENEFLQLAREGRRNPNHLKWKDQ